MLQYAKGVDDMSNQESSENYLETILMLSHGAGKVRSVDIAERLGYTKASVSVAMKKLNAEGFIQIDKGAITLTESGRVIACTMYERHIVISEWLIALGVDADIALEDACRMEHHISQQSFEAIKNHIKDWKQHAYEEEK